MPESTMRQTFVKCLKDARLDPISVENSAYPGTPDVNCTCGWIELKQLDGWPVRANTPVRIDHFTPQQKVWLIRRWLIQGDGAWLLIKVKREWLLLTGDNVQFVGKWTQAELRSICLAIETDPREIVKWIDGRYPVIPPPEDTSGGF